MDVRHAAEFHARTPKRKDQKSLLFGPLETLPDYVAFVSENGISNYVHEHPRLGQGSSASFFNMGPGGEAEGWGPAFPFAVEQPDRPWIKVDYAVNPALTLSSR